MVLLLNGIADIADIDWFGIVWYCNSLGFGCAGFNTATDIAWYCNWNCIVLHFIVLQYCL